MKNTLSFTVTCSHLIGKPRCFSRYGFIKDLLLHIEYGFSQPFHSGKVSVQSTTLLKRKESLALWRFAVKIYLSCLVLREIGESNNFTHCLYIVHCCGLNPYPSLPEFDLNSARDGEKHLTCRNVLKATDTR